MENLIFSTLPISKETAKAIEAMGFEEATPIQSQAIPPLLEGNDVIAQAPTGTGKTCAFGIPMVELLESGVDTIQGVVLCPTRELVIQTTEEVQRIAQFKKGVKIVPIYGGQQIERQIMALKKRPSIIIATPGRLMDHMRRKTIKLQNLKMLVLDEADEMLNMGFREDLDVILETVPEERQTVLFSATMSPAILDIANKYQKDESVNIKIAHKELTVPTITQYYLEVKNQKRMDVLTRLIDTNEFKLSIVFCNTKRRVEEVTAELGLRGYAAEALHGDMKQVQRDRVMNRFKKGTVDILVATDVAARGIDINDIDAVFNFEIPSDEEYYVHRIGRTGRAKREGVAYSFVNGREMYKLRDIMRYTKAHITRMQAPSVSDVESIRVEGIFKSAQELLEKGSLSTYTQHIETLLNADEFDSTSIDLAAALLRLLVEGRVAGGSNTEATNIGKFEAEEIGEENGADDGMVRLFLNIGSLDKVHPRHLTNLLKKQGLESYQIGKLDILDKYSFVEVSYECADRVIAGLTGMTYGRRKLDIEVANKKNDDKPRNRNRKRGKFRR